MSQFLVDSNFFIQAHRSTYPFDVLPSFWNKVKDLAQQEKIISIDKVKAEIFQNEDDLKDWCQNNLPENFFKDSTTCIDSYTQVATWAVSRNDHFKQTAIEEFLDADEADAWLVSYALHNGLTVITHEISQPTRKNKIKIPDACLPFNIPFMNTIEMLRQLGERF